MKLYAFSVEIIGLFPFDMLRYDRCWPATEKDALALGTKNFHLTTEEFFDPRRVHLVGLRAPTYDKWMSFATSVWPDTYETIQLFEDTDIKEDT